MIDHAAQYVGATGNAAEGRLYSENRRTEARRQPRRANSK